MPTRELMNEIWEYGSYRGGSTCLRLIPFLKKHIPIDSVVNDYGSGTGRAEVELFNYCKKINMVDVSDIALEEPARALLGDKLSITVSPLETLPVDFPVSDWGICINVLMIVEPENIFPIMAEMRRTCNNLIIEVYDAADFRLGKDRTLTKGGPEFWHMKMKEHWPLVESHPSPEHKTRYITIGRSI